MQEDLLDVWKISCLQFFFSLVFFDPKNGIISLDILELFITSNIIEARRTWLWIWPGTTRAAGLVFWKHFQKWPIVWWMDDVIDGWDLFLAETLAATQNDLGGVWTRRTGFWSYFGGANFVAEILSNNPSKHDLETFYRFGWSLVHYQVLVHISIGVWPI